MSGQYASSITAAAAASLYKQAETERVAGHYDEACRLGTQASEAAEAAGESLILIKSLLLLSKSLRVQGKLETAFVVTTRATVAARDYGDDYLLCTALYMGGAIKTELGLQEEALSDMEQALEIAMKLDDTELLYWCYNRSGIQQINLGRYDAADKMMLKSLHYAQKLGIEEKFCILNNLNDNISQWDNSLAENGEELSTETLERALAYGEEALGYARESKNPYRESMILVNIGMSLGLLGRFPEALDCLTDGQEIAERHDYRSLVLSAFHYRGKVLLRMGEVQPAVDCLEKARAIADEISEDLSSRDICRSLASGYEMLGDTGAALRYYRIHHQLDRKIASAQAELKASIMADRVALINARIDAEQARAELADRSTELEKSIRSLTAIVEQADKRAQTDALTGLCNRHYLNSEFDKRVTGALAEGKQLALAMIDVDHFKSVNDRFGHTHGDRVLQVIGKLLRNSLRTGDIAVRYGGEEFLLLLPETTAAEAARLCERLRHRIERQDWDMIADGLKITASFGITGLLPEDTPERMIIRADANLYMAKDSGRNRLSVA